MVYIQWVLTLVSGLLFLGGALWLVHEAYSGWKDPFAAWSRKEDRRNDMWFDIGVASGLLACSAAVLSWLV